MASVTVGGQSCDNAAALSDAQLTCDVPPGVGTQFDLEVSVTGQVSTQNSFMSYERAVVNDVNIKAGNREGRACLL